MVERQNPLSLATKGLLKSFLSLRKITKPSFRENWASLISLWYIQWFTLMSLQCHETVNLTLSL